MIGRSQSRGWAGLSAPATLLSDASEGTAMSKLSKMPLAALWTLLAAPPQAGAQCVDYRDYLRPVCSLELPGLAWGAATDGNVALVTSSDGELRVVDLANPSEPIIAATLATGGEASGVEIRGRFGYVAAGEVGVVVVDIADPYAPEVVATVDTPGRARAVCLSGDWAYVAGLEGGVQVLDIADPRQVNLVASFCDSFFVQDIAVLDGKAYVAAGYDGLLVVDVKDPRHGRFEGAVAGLWDAAAVAAEGRHVYSLESSPGVVDVVEVGSLTGPRVVQSFYLPDWGNDVMVSGGRLYATGNENGLFVVDVSDLEAPRLVGGIDTPGAAVAVNLGAGLAVVADLYRGLTVVDVASPQAPPRLGEVLTTYAPDEIQVQGEYAYCLAYDSLNIVDISEPSAMAVAGALDFAPNRLHGLAVAGGLACFAENGRTLRIVDITNVASPAVMASLALPGHAATTVALADDLALVSDYWQGLQFVDLADPGQPRLLGTVPWNECPGHVAVSGRVAYAAAGAAGLHIIDFSDPAQPFLASTLAFGGATYHVAVRGEYAYVVGEPVGLQVLDISDRLLPRAVAACPSVVGSFSLAPDSDYAYVRQGRGFKILDLRDPLQPRVVGEMFQSGEIAGLCGAVDGVLVGDWDAGLVMFPAQCTPVAAVGPAPVASRAPVIHVAPNPLTTRAEIAFEVEGAGRVDVEVFDIAGRRVRRFHGGTAGAGPARLTWDGRDDSGRSLPAGVYFVKVRSGRTTSTARMALVR